MCVNKKSRQSKWFTVGGRIDVVSSEVEINNDAVDMREFCFDVVVEKILIGNVVYKMRFSSKEYQNK
jgi:hypothetical protein